jgi:hypothetical protein
LRCISYFDGLTEGKDGPRSDIIAPGKASVLHVHFKLNFILMD